MSKPLLIAAATAAAFAGLGFAAPAAAQANEKVLIVYGKDPCPTTKAGEEIVVCARKPESDRYRIPEDLRTTNPGPADRWADRAKSLQSVGASGTGSCTATGAGGWGGCWSKMMNEARDQRKADATETRAPTDSTTTGDTGVRAVLKGDN
ncbi:hypothetical protein Q4F19_06245 [Sphingomonas sp. BIUV-7]|uniref:Uncharacterized protein n=1 Tax=Sphingomonas natans TaxID=3063330 RepID=A0ABT8Y6P9_9SPHN|nr:hypothetical protein [Sphingomonas sp. BIUV-7]MDO6413976.1 hypothetical protein [Sphingomonas sp. BIUV-7]